MALVAVLVPLVVGDDPAIRSSYARFDQRRPAARPLSCLRWGASTSEMLLQGGLAGICRRADNVRWRLFNIRADQPGC